MVSSVKRIIMAFHPLEGERHWLALAGTSARLPARLTHNSTSAVVSVFKIFIKIRSEFSDRNGGKTRFSPCQGQLNLPAHFQCQALLHGCLAPRPHLIGSALYPTEVRVHMLEIIPVKPSSSSSGYIMVELQGELEFDSDQKAIVRQIGVMAQAHQGGDTLQLTIGHHQLTGKLVDLKKPLLVLEKGSEPQTCYRVSRSDELFLRMTQLGNPLKN